MGRDISRVIVLGAGASCSYLKSSTGLRPPLAREIISTFNKLDISENRFVLVGHIINYVRDTRGVPPSDFGSWDEDLESFFSEVDEEVAVMAEKVQNGVKFSTEEFYKYILAVGAYNQLIFLFASIFNEIQNGPVSIPYTLLADELNHNDVVITFNWDTLLDRVLYTANVWSPNKGYCIKPEAIFDNKWKSPDEFEYKDNEILYLKLHGSTNWLAPCHGVHLSTGQKYSMSKYAIDKLFVFLKSTKAYETYENRYWGPYKPFSYCYYPPNLPVTRDNKEPGRANIRIVSAIDLPEHGKIVINEKDIFSMPLIVPPVRNKQYKRYGRIFSTLWKLAEESISKCDQLYIIGYSFPKTDIATREMFKNAIKRNVSIEKIVIINPQPRNIKHLFLNEFNVKASKLEIREKKFGVPLTYKEKLL